MLRKTIDNIILRCYNCIERRVNMKFVKRKKDNSISYQISLRPEYLLMSGIKEDDKLIAIAKKGQIIIKKIDKEEE